MAQVIYCDTRNVGEVIERLGAALSPQEVNKAMARALNRTLTFVGAETKRQVQGEYYVTKSLQKSVTKKRATSGNLTAEAIYTGKPIPLFTFKNSAPANMYRSPVTVTVKRSNGPQTHAGSNPAMFRAYGKKIKLRDAGQKNIRGAYTVSIPQMVANKKVYKEIARKAEDYLYKRVVHEMERSLAKV